MFDSAAKSDESIPLLSVVTCTYNSEQYLEKCLRSVEMQTYDRIEHIINDSYSEDGTRALIEAYIRRINGRYAVRLIECPPKGVANALNVATQAATGDIIHYLHSDDYYGDEDALQRAMGYFIQNPQLVWMTGNYWIEFKGRRFILPQTLLLKDNPQSALSVMNIIHHDNTFMRRDAVIAYGGFCEDRRFNVEYALWLRLIREHLPLVVDDQFAVFVIHKGSTSTGSPLRFAKCFLRAFRTQRQEKVLPLIGRYEEKPLYRRSRKWVMGVYSWGMKLIFG